MSGNVSAINAGVAYIPGWTTHQKSATEKHGRNTELKKILVFPSFPCFFRVFPWLVFASID
jgi:hypothetical protein